MIRMSLGGASISASATAIRSGAGFSSLSNSIPWTGRSAIAVIGLRSLSTDDEPEDARIGARFRELVAGCAGPCREVLHGPGVRCEDFHEVARLDSLDRLGSPDDRQGARQPARIDV